MRFDEFFYPAAFVLLLSWLVFQSVAPQGGEGSEAESLAEPTSWTQHASVQSSSESQLPQLTATANVNGRDYQILVGGGPPTWSVAVSSEP